MNGSAVRLMKSYVKYRKQCARISNIYSYFEIIIFEVPQGSILWPLLFNLSINDLKLAKVGKGELGLTSKFVASHLDKETIASHILSKISGSKDSQKINFGQYLVKK